MDRRLFLSTGSAAALSLPLASSPVSAQATAAAKARGDAKLNALFEKIFQDRVKRSPSFATSLGLDKGPNAALKSTLDIRPQAAARAEDMALAKRELAQIRAIAPSALSASAKLNRDVIIYQYESGMIAPQKFGIDSTQRPYRIFQQGGAYFSLPDFLNTAHTIDTAADAEAYLARLALVDTIFDNDSAEQRAQAVIPRRIVARVEGHRRLQFLDRRVDVAVGEQQLGRSHLRGRARPARR